jgi:fermentation-respiration switch protein FrsA (DUF1100 family)
MTSAFTSVPDLAAIHYFMFPVRLLARYQYNTRKYLEAVACPVLIVHSREDEIVPFKHSEQLYAAAHEPKQLLELHGGHNTHLILSHDLWMKGVGKFLDRYFSAGERIENVKENRA